MAQQNVQSETSMEDILASIRRIISEEEAPPAQPALELTQAAPVDDDILVFDDPEPTPQPAPRAQPAPVPAPMGDSWGRTIEAAASESILSEPSVQAAAGAFTRLAGSLRIADTAGQTLEGVVRELLNPMLREWLDQNLPAIVEAKVEAELERIVRLSR
jgi:cell pole-organizing protein PopZ